MWRPLVGAEERGGMGSVGRRAVLRKVVERTAAMWASGASFECCLHQSGDWLQLPVEVLVAFSAQQLTTHCVCV